MRTMIGGVCFLLSLSSAWGAPLRVPQEHASIQAAIEVAVPGDTIVVAPGTYRECLRLKPGVILRSAGDDERGTVGLRRAELTIIDGTSGQGRRPGVEMSAESTLDGFTVTNVGQYDDAEWRRHWESQGEELGDEEGAVQAEGTTPAIAITGVNCSVTRCIVHHNGDVGIGILGKKQATTAPIIRDNHVYRNMGGGIGAAEGAEPVIRGNVCYENLRAGIGCRAAHPLIVDNECRGNVRAGIGCREGSQAVIRQNRCWRNRRAGIGIRMPHTAPVVEANECYENELAGIGCRDGARPWIGRNTCRGNKLVAIGITGASTATIVDNDLARDGGMPPLLAVRGQSTAFIQGNRFSGGGVAAVIVDGRATLVGNTFVGRDPPSGQGIWIWENATANIADNSFEGYATAVSAGKASVVVTGNTIRRFRGTAIVVKASSTPARVWGNTAVSNDPAARSVDVQGPMGLVEENVVQRE